MSYMLDGWDLWESEKNLQYLLDSCGSEELRIENCFEELETAANAEDDQFINNFDIPAGKRSTYQPNTIQGYYADHCDINDPVEMYCNIDHDLLKDKNKDSLENPTVSDNNELPSNVQECITEQTNDINHVDMFFNTENILLKDNIVNSLEKHADIIDDKESRRILPYVLQEYIHDQWNNNPHMLCNIETVAFQNETMGSPEKHTPSITPSICPLPSSIPRQERYEKCFPCELCGNVLASKYNLKKHILITHNVEKPFACNICDRMFKRKGDLKMHKLTHSNDKPFACNICERSFKRNGDLKEHIVTHSDGKPYSCHVCGNRFTQHSTLRTHILTHSGEHPFSCNICGKTFSVKTNLTAHKLTHSREQPFSCDICGKKFSLKGNLKRHKAIHIDEKLKLWQ